MKEEMKEKMKEDKKDKKKKEKVTYIDDGRTIADMSGVKGSMDFAKKGTTSSISDIWKTYWMATRMMVKPMLVVILFLCIIFGFAYIFFSLL